MLSNADITMDMIALKHIGGHTRTTPRERILFVLRKTYIHFTVFSSKFLILS